MGYHTNDIQVFCERSGFHIVGSEKEYLFRCVSGLRGGPKMSQLPKVRGAIFKSFPAKWKLFVNDPDAEGRYRLVNESETATQTTGNVW